MKMNKKTLAALKASIQIHRDGGHYAAEHGILKACADAERIITDERKALQEMTAQRDALAAKLEGAK